MKRPGSASDPLWFKDAIIYEVHVRAFHDNNADGIGDFQGLIQKLDYLQDLGVTCIWVLPFFPSPLRDDGYDIADYLNVNPSYGTADDFKSFLHAAHARDLQVMIELVINHTSDQHPWFQAARNAPAGSPERAFYVWSNTGDEYRDARIIFTDTEKSNWTWDPVAKAYFWHRFFSHQPDLNFDNPRVLEEVLKVMRYWLDMGVDGLRMDAIPYLVERDGTNCENLPETHRIIREIRKAIDADYSNRVILAEANQWPTDVRPYFGDGDECHMAFHFPLMPRMYMALRQEDRLPVTDIMAQTPEIPETCQWGLFLRNHDELTLEMVTHDERDYMYLAYSADPRTRINLGIRRRLAPLMDNSRRRIELLNSLLFSLPGTPIIYYGDEIGMGDNVYLGDRNGVRTPMQWNPDRNAGFSRANPAMLYSPVIMDAVWGYLAVNVEAQQGDPSSLLNWMRNMIALRKLFKVFGRGTLEFLHPPNRKILAYLRRYQDETVLCVTNLSRFAQPVDLDLAELYGMVPVEMLGYVEFPPITRQPYRLTLSPYAFLWLELHAATEPPARSSRLLFSGEPESLFEGLKAILPEYLEKQRWFGGKSRTIRSAEIKDWVRFSPDTFLTLVEVRYSTGQPDLYFLPLATTLGPAPGGVVSLITSAGGEGALYDAMCNDTFCTDLLKAIAGSSTIGEVHAAGKLTLDEAPLPVRLGTAEQSNTSVVYGDKYILKLFRRLQPGVNPELEIARYLTEQSRFEHIAPFKGAIEFHSFTIAILQGFVANEGDGWNWTLEELERYYENCAPATIPDDFDSPAARDHVGAWLESAANLGRRTAELHVALAGAGHEPFTCEAIEAMSARMLDEAAAACDLLKASLSRLPDEVVAMAGFLLGNRRRVLDVFHIPCAGVAFGQLIRVHGDYHLGQVLRTRADFVILDFEGEPAKPLAERRARATPLKDVAGMLRSFSYATNRALMDFVARHPEDLSRLEPWARLWEHTVAAEFIRAYLSTAEGAPFLPADPRDFRRLLEACVLEKAFYELTYELNNRPDWVRIPLVGILDQ